MFIQCKRDSSPSTPSVDMRKGKGTKRKFVNDDVPKKSRVLRVSATYIYILLSIVYCYKGIADVDITTDSKQTAFMFEVYHTIRYVCMYKCSYSAKETAVLALLV